MRTRVTELAARTLRRLNHFRFAVILAQSFQHPDVGRPADFQKCKILTVW